MQKTTLFMRFKAKPGKRDEVRQIWQNHLQSNIQANTAFEGYFYCFDDNDPDAICVFQITANREAPQEFVKTSWYAAYHQDVAPLLVDQGEFRTATPMWVKAAA